MGSLSCRLDFHVVHQLLAAGKPCVGGNNSLMGSQHQHLVFQVIFLASLYVPPLIQIAPVCACEVGSVIDNNCPLTFEKLIYVRVCLYINRVA